ncbi:DNA adenine methylase [Pedobacter polaris]|uniref:site-specific DNA-methyltransferase (adenine-specific) n=1 Tax=Pedobacter polaris TaxID=2571273 RepID=A0A4U1CSK9_9SPHI|nr:DNA adenine methylase [Pedobacter polaris]TKC10040.1 DNA adenine methylase [Pedobacter polaris]
MKNKLRPIIKWTGGKYDEFALFANHIPTFTRYIEPFFGGGGVFFALQPKVKSFINDKSTDLVNFYQQLGNNDFKSEILKYADAWDELGKIHNLLWESCSESYSNYINKETEISQLNDIITEKLTKALKSDLLINDEAFIIDRALFKKMLLSSIADKARRIKRICEKEQRVFNYEELRNHFETGIRSGAYLFFRTLLNKEYHKTLLLTPAKTAANWYFVREFCYGSMFRFNARGEFNIPYGGIAYNKKKFRQKAEKIFDKSITELFNNTEVFNLDFEAFLNKISLEESDFIFLDPPYDSEFSEYDQSAFTQDDQQRLATFLIQAKSKWMVVIKETGFIKEIYTHPLVKITTFDKNYVYNVRGRNNRAVRHLIITNY